MPIPARSATVAASTASAGSAARTLSAVGPPANSSTNTRCVANRPKAAITPAPTVAAATTPVRSRSARQLMPRAVQTSLGSSAKTAKTPASARARTPVSHHISRNSGSTDSVRPG